MFSKIKFHQRGLSELFLLFNLQIDMKMYTIHEQKENDSNLKQYDQDNQHFSIRRTSIIEDKQEIIGYDCTYHYEDWKVQLKYDLSNANWEIINEDFSSEEINQLNILLDFNRNLHLSFEQQISLIIQRFDQHFSQRKLLLISPIKEEDQHLVPGIKSDRTRQDSSSSSTCSIKYTQFVPPTIGCIRRRRVIQSILLRVQRKKKLFDEILATLISSSIERTMYHLGLEFLKIYDGKFNFPQGHTFVITFEKRTWFLTIENIKCIECQLGENEPRSILILNYKNQFTTIQL